jgi:hypothetical protein
METTNTLPLNIRKNHFDYTCIKSGEKAFIYSQCYDQINGIYYYEVFRKVIRKECVFHGKLIPEHIAFPGNEDFGVWAWSFRDKDKAEKKFNQLENELQNFN